MTHTATMRTIVLRALLGLVMGAAVVVVAPTGATAASWSGWHRLDGSLGSKPAVASWAPGRLDVFTRGTDGTSGLYHKWWQGGWSRWENLGGVLASAPAAVSWGPGHIAVVALGTDDVLRLKSYSGGRWTGWSNLGLVVEGSPAIASWAPGRLDVFATRWSDLALMHRVYTGGRWHAWEVLTVNSLCAEDPAAVSWGANRVDVFRACSGINQGMFHMWWDGRAWRSERLFGGSLDPELGLGVASWAPGRLDVFGIGATDEFDFFYNVYQRTYQAGSGWSAWRNLDDARFSGVSGPAATSWGPGRVDVFVAGPQSVLYHDAYG